MENFDLYMDLNISPRPGLQIGLSSYGWSGQRQSLASVLEMIDG